jgi:hypothetical protein
MADSSLSRRYRAWHNSDFIFVCEKIFVFLIRPVLRIRDPGWVKIRIRDKHPGSATLDKTEAE